MRPSLFATALLAFAVSTACGSKLFHKKAKKGKGASAPAEAAPLPGAETGKGASAPAEAAPLPGAETTLPAATTQAGDAPPTTVPVESGAETTVPATTQAAAPFDLCATLLAVKFQAAVKAHAEKICDPDVLPTLGLDANVYLAGGASKLKLTHADTSTSLQYTLLSIVRAPATPANALALFKLQLTKPEAFKDAGFRVDPDLSVTDVVAGSEQISAHVNRDDGDATVTYPAVSRIHELGPTAFAIESYEGPHPNVTDWETLEDYASLMVVIARDGGSVDRILSYGGTVVLPRPDDADTALAKITKVWRDAEIDDAANLKASASLAP